MLLIIGCCLMSLMHARLLVGRGLAVQQRLAGELAWVNGHVAAVITPARPDDPEQWGRIALRLDDGAIIQLSGGVGHLLPGQRIRVQARFSVPQPQRNPGGFDERLYLARDAIFLNADLFLGRVSVLDARCDPLGLLFLRIRGALSKTALAVLSVDEAGLLLGILIGDTSLMGKAHRDAFQAAGLSHLTAVSGANVSFLMAPVAGLLALMFRRRRQRIAALALFVVGFGFLTGWEASVTRAILMAVLALTGKLARRRSDPLNALLFAATAMMVCWPLLIISLSFHLSFLATAGILLAQARLAEIFQRWLPHWPNSLRSILALNLSVQLTVLPLQALATGSFSPLSLLVNLPALPLAEGVTLLGAVLLPSCMALQPLAVRWPFLAALLRLLAWPVHALLQALMRLAAIFSDESWPRILTGSLPAIAFLGFAVWSACLVIRLSALRRKARKMAAILLSAALILQIGGFINRPELEIWILDVGQADALVIRARDGTTTLIDAGTSKAGVDAVQPALLAIGIRRLTQAIVTHGHSDHAGGLPALIHAGALPCLIAPQMALDLSLASHARDRPDAAPAARADGMESDVLADVLLAAEQAGVTVQGVRKGDTIPVGSGATLAVLAPEMPASLKRAQAIERQRGANATSLILRLSSASGGWSMLLTGDCDREAEQDLLASGMTLRADVLRVAHHGSNATTGKPLLSAVQPSAALISVGRNDYGHPASDLLDRLADQSIPVLRTDRQGAIVIRVTGASSTVRTYVQNDWTH